MSRVPCDGRCGTFSKRSSRTSTSDPAVWIFKMGEESVWTLTDDSGLHLLSEHDLLGDHDPESDKIFE